MLEEAEAGVNWDYVDSNLPILLDSSESTLPDRNPGVRANVEMLQHCLLRGTPGGFVCWLPNGIAARGQRIGFYVLVVKVTVTV